MCVCVCTNTAACKRLIKNSVNWCVIAGSCATCLLACLPWAQCLTLWAQGTGWSPFTFILPKSQTPSEITDGWWEHGGYRAAWRERQRDSSSPSLGLPLKTPLRKWTQTQTDVSNDLRCNLLLSSDKEVNIIIGYFDKNTPFFVFELSPLCHIKPELEQHYNAAR